jgi:acyl dehydratase
LPPIGNAQLTTGVLVWGGPIANHGGLFMSEITLDDYKAMVGQEVGVSRWFEVPQGRINTFADVTEDHQFIHVDPERAKATPFGGTVAHGFLTMSLLAPMAFDAQPRLTGTAMSVNYGFDRVRLMAPVRAGSRIRGRFVLKELVDRGPKEIMAKTQVTVEIEGGDKPALVADWLGLTRFA